LSTIRLDNQLFKVDARSTSTFSFVLEVYSKWVDEGGGPRLFKAGTKTVFTKARGTTVMGSSGAEVVFFLFDEVTTEDVMPSETPDPAERNL